MPAIHQLVAGFSNGDAISNEALALRRIFRGWGHPSDIFCELRRILPELRPEARDLTTAAAALQPDDVVLLHLSIGSDANEIFAGLPGRKALIYHNMTPPDYFRGFQEQLAGQLAQGREQARRLAGAAAVNLADSEFNAAELRALGYRDVQVLPLVLDFERLRAGGSRPLLDKYADGLVNILFVGRGAPNKRVDDALAAFHYFQRYVVPDSRFIHVGAYTGLESYEGVIRTRIRELALVNVELTGNLPQADLNACYQRAHVFLSMSEHEGFCIPLIEAMVFDVPILAYAAGAVPETLAGAGVLFREKRFDLVAEMLGRLARDAHLRAAVLARQRERLERYESRDLEAELRTQLAPLLHPEDERVPALHQFVAGFNESDAISNEARRLRRLFQGWGLASEIFCERQRIPPHLRREARDAATAAQLVQPGDVVLLHLSIGSPVNDLFRQLACRKALRYHNITPPEFFQEFFEPYARQLRAGREQLRALAGVAAVNLAVSEFNAAELRAAGYGAVAVLPLALDFGRLRSPAGAAARAEYDDGRVNVLFVGRGVPNKRIEDLLAAFYYFQRYVEPDSRLLHVGSYAGLERYAALVFTRARELQLAHVELTGPLPQAELNACYRSASVFLCMSEHEGFGIPLIEAMVHDVPVLAFAAGAVPETLAGAGVLFREKRFDLVAELLGRLVRDQRLRAAVLAGQRARLARYEHRDLAAELRRHLAPLLT